MIEIFENSYPLKMHEINKCNIINKFKLDLVSVQTTNILKGMNVKKSWGLEGGGVENFRNIFCSGFDDDFFIYVSEH